MTDVPVQVYNTIQILYFQ